MLIINIYREYDNGRGRYEGRRREPESREVLLEAEVLPRRSVMIANVKARYSNGVLTPLEPLDLEEGKEVVVSIEDGPQPLRGLASVVAKAKELQKDIPPEAWDDLPRDLAKNKKHYLYGHPKETD